LYVEMISNNYNRQIPLEKNGATAINKNFADI
jgi:hypothetical protein